MDSPAFRSVATIAAPASSWPVSALVTRSWIGLFYDSIVLADLPANGRFQQLKPGVGPSGLATEFGPGDTGYLGGRWWIDANDNGYMDEGDAFFLCPLLGPGRSVL